MNEIDVPIPKGKGFIFTIFDDTDVSTYGNIRPIYDFLSELGVYTTKSVWPLDYQQRSSNYLGSHSLQNTEYSNYVKEIAARGFEIAFHGASMESNTREVTIKALKYFVDIMGFPPRTYACHAGNRENIYWGEYRFTNSLLRAFYRAFNGKQNGYSGHDPKSAYYWADLCRETFDYVRTFTFNGINLLNNGKFLYSTKERPCFKSCFCSNFADNVEEFNRLLSVKNQQKLENERGVCIVTTHFGKGFVKDGALNSTTKKLLERLACRNGYFAPVCNVLDHFTETNIDNTIQKMELFWLEFRWLVHTIQRKRKRLKYEKTELQYLGIK